MSYHETTFTNCFPSTSSTLVDNPSTSEPHRLPIQSLETIGSIVNSSVSLVCDFNTSFISSLVVFLPNSSVKSTTLPVGTGTRIAVPSSFPAKLGQTSPIADAAPVDAGTMFAAHALPRRAKCPFLCAISSDAWSFV